LTLEACSKKPLFSKHALGFALCTTTQIQHDRIQHKQQQQQDNNNDKQQRPFPNQPAIISPRPLFSTDITSEAAEIHLIGAHNMDVRSNQLELPQYSPNLRLKLPRRTNDVKLSDGGFGTRHAVSSLFNLPATLPKPPKSIVSAPTTWPSKIAAII
jgi:hypothetical protein